LERFLLADNAYDYNKDMHQVVYMLCGLPGSGKSTYAQKLAAEGLSKLSPDEETYARYGRPGVDYPKQEYIERYKVVLVALEQSISELLKQKKSFILDYGYWRYAHREKHKKLIEHYGAEWKLLYFRADSELLAARLEKRNKQHHANAFPVNKDMLCNFMTRFEEPRNEGETIIEQS
jgi:predicted kinase